MNIVELNIMQASFAWDWGPALPGAGLWSVPQLIFINDSTIFDTTTDVEFTPHKLWKLTVTVHLENAPSSPSKPISGTLSSSLILKPAKWNRGTNSYDPEEAVTSFMNITLTDNSKTSVLSLTVTIPESKV